MKKSYITDIIDYAYSISKNDIDQSIANFLTSSLYYSIASPMARPYIEGTTFDYHVAEAIGFKLFLSTVTPAILQGVSTYSEAPLELLDRSWSDFSWFNTTAYTEVVNDNFAKLTAENLMFTGLLNAISIEIMNEVYHQFDFAAASQNFLFKYGINSYFKDWIQSELNNTLTDLNNLSNDIIEKVQPHDIFESPPLFDSSYRSGPLNGTMKESVVDQAFEPICRVHENELAPTAHEF